MRPCIETVSDSFATVLAYIRDDSELVGHGAGELVDDLSATIAVPKKIEEVRWLVVEGVSLVINRTSTRSRQQRCC